MATKRVVFTGSFMEFFIYNVGLTVLSIVTFGLALIYQTYWNGKYFISHIEIEA